MLLQSCWSDTYVRPFNSITCDISSMVIRTKALKVANGRFSDLFQMNTVYFGFNCALFITVEQNNIFASFFPDIHNYLKQDIILTNLF